MQLSSSTTTTVFKPSLLNTPETMQKGLEGIKKASQMGFLTLQKRKKERNRCCCCCSCWWWWWWWCSWCKETKQQPQKITACRPLRIWIPTCKDLVPNQEPWWCDCENQPSLSSFPSALGPARLWKRWGSKLRNGLQHWKAWVLPTYLHTYLPTYLPTYLHTYLHTYLFTYLFTYLLTGPSEQPACLPSIICCSWGFHCVSLYRPIILFLISLSFKSSKERSTSLAICHSLMHHHPLKSWLYDLWLSCGWILSHLSLSLSLSLFQTIQRRK